jgi:hypothetical protein
MSHRRVAGRNVRPAAVAAAAVAAALAAAPPAAAAEATAPVPRVAVPGQAASRLGDGGGGSGFTELARAAPVVVRARVLRRAARRDARGLIVTDTRLRVEEVVAGDARPGGELTLTTLGGVLAGEELAVSHMPRLEQDASYVLFVDPRRETYDPVVGNDKGAFRVGPGGEVLTHDGAEVLGVEGGELRLGRGPGDGPGDAGPPRVSGGVAVVGPAGGPEAAAAATAASPMDATAFAAAIRSLRQGGGSER